MTRARQRAERKLAQGPQELEGRRRSLPETMPESMRATMRKTGRGQSSLVSLRRPPQAPALPSGPAECLLA